MEGSGHKVMDRTSYIKLIGFAAIILAAYFIIRVEGCFHEHDDPFTQDTTLVSQKVENAERDGRIKLLVEKLAEKDSTIALLTKKSEALQTRADRKVIIYRDVKPNAVAKANDTTVPCQERVDTLLAVLNDCDTAISYLVDVKNMLLSELAAERSAKAIRDAIISDQNINAAGYKNMIASLEKTNRELSHQSWWDKHRFELGFITGTASTTIAIIAIR
jgi:hypothetical protein